MTDSQFNPNDPLFWVSRALDSDLAESDRRRLDEALSQSGALREEADKLRSVDQLASQWGREHIAIDWNHFSTTIEALAVHESEANELDKVDVLVRQWAGADPQVDWTDFSEGVLSEIEPQRQSFKFGSLVRLGVPLAAAAVLVFALSNIYWQTPPIKKTTETVAQAESPKSPSAAMDSPSTPSATRVAKVAIQRRRDGAQQRIGPNEGPRVAVAFSQELPVGFAMGPAESDISLIAVSSSSATRLVDAYPSM